MVENIMTNLALLRIAFGLAALGMLGCGNDTANNGPAPGTERGACYPNGTCNAGLTCASNVCVNLAPDASLTDASTADASGADAGDAAAGCVSYATSTIAAMRTAGTPGCFELDTVVNLGVTTSTSSPRIFVQDSSGGDYSAMMVRCSSTDGAHPCAVAATVSGIPSGHGVTVKGTFAKSGNGLDEFYLDAITDDGAAANTPAPISLTTSDVTRTSAAARAKVSYQIVTVSLGGALQVYDWAPGDLVQSGAAQCPYLHGFGVVPFPGSPGSSQCQNGTSQPTGAASQADEILIGADFFAGFTTTTDCRCAKAEHGSASVVPTMASQISGSLKGLLVVDGDATPYLYIAPESNADATVSALTPGL